MPNFLENIFSQLKRADGRVVLREIRGEDFVSLTGGEMLGQRIGAAVQVKQKVGRSIELQQGRLAETVHTAVRVERVICPPMLETEPSHDALDEASQRVEPSPSGPGPSV